ncbi:MAG TPA: HD domain-containing phosphohydrolase, partial [Solirubrobacteraceae bacterium]|nr:HD domain-containing phosphohydrolase [Solirubrobacteraceae bacterium]
MLSVRVHSNREQSHVSRETVGLLLKILNERDPGVLEDLNRMGHLAMDTAKALRLPDHEVERIELAARLHDVGKLTIPDAILHKPGPLNDDEWEIMRTHPEAGARIVAAAPSIAHIQDLVRYHHEQYNGRGYSAGLARDRIPLGACIIAVCAAFVAMMRHRPYSDAVTVV